MNAGPELPSTDDDLRILIVGDDPLARSGLTGLLAGRSGCVIVGDVSPRDDLAGAATALQADVVLWDAGPGGAWPPSAAGGRVTDLAVPIVALLADGADATDAITAGARGVLGRDAGADVVLQALKGASAGLVVIDPDLADLVWPPRGPVRSEEPVEALTPREHQVLQLLAEGLANKEIAGRLGISDHTAKFHVTAILEKVGAQSRTEAVIRAARLGLITL